MKRLPRIAFLGLLVSFIFITLGCVLAINSCAKDSSDEPQIDSDSFHKRLEYVKLPAKTPEQIKDYTGFTVSFNKDNHTPNYVSWELKASEVGGTISRTDNFWQDAEIEGCPDQYAYRYSGYDRGHMCPAADQKWSEDAMNDCFVMANMCPQKNDLNAKAWETLESKERQWAQRDGAIWIVAGPIYYETDTEKIGNYNVRVPSAFFKAILAIEVANPRAIAFVYPNMLAPGNMQDYAMSIDELEELTGYDFFSALPDDIEQKVEASYSFTEWNRPY